MIGTKMRRLATYAAALSVTTGMVVTGLSVGSATAGGVPGVTSNSVTIGTTQPVTGIASPGYNEIAKAANAVFAYINSKGGVNGRKIHMIVKDDCYNTPFGFKGCASHQGTVAQTNALLAAPVFATVGALGTPTQDLVRTLLNNHKVPQLFVDSGSRDWNCATLAQHCLSNGATGTHVAYPTLFGWQPSYIVESKILAKYIKAHVPGKLCFFGQNDDFGKDGYKGLVDAGAVPTNNAFYSSTSLALSSNPATYIGGFIGTLKSKGCQVMFLDTVPAATALSLAVAASLRWAPKWVVSGVGSDPTTVDNVLGGAIGPNPEAGVISFSYLPLPGSSVGPTKWLPWIKKVLLAGFPGFHNNTTIDGPMINGVGWAVTFAEALKAAGANFNRTTFVNSLLSTNFQYLPTVTPLKYSTANHQGLNGGYVIKITASSTVSVADSNVYVSNATASTPVTLAPALTANYIPPWIS